MRRHASVRAPHVLRHIVVRFKSLLRKAALFKWLFNSSSSSLADLVVMILQWSPRHLINGSIASRKIVRQDVGACLVDIPVAILFGRGRRRVGWNVRSRQHLGEQWTCGTSGQVFLLWWQFDKATSEEMSRTRTQREKSMEDSSDFAERNFLKVSIVWRNTCQHHAFPH